MGRGCWFLFWRKTFGLRHSEKDDLEFSGGSDCDSPPAETPWLNLMLTSQCLEQADRISSPGKMNEEQCSSEMHVPKDCASPPAEPPEFYLKLASQCLEQVDRISSPPKFNEEQCKYLVHKLRLATMSTSSIMEQIETEFLSLALPGDKVRLLEIFKVLYSMGKEVEDFTQSCCGESWIQSAILLTNMSERVATIGFNLEFCTIVLSERTIGMRGSLKYFNVAGARQAEADIVKEMTNIDEMDLIMDLNTITQSDESSSVECQLASFLLGRLEMVQLRSGATLPTSNNECHLQMGSSLKQMGLCLGKGTSASVHKAEWLGVEVAKKTFYGPKNGDFFQEVSILEGLSHPNIVSLLWYTTDEKRCHLVMELMDGDLHSLMQKRMEENGDQNPPFCISEALDLILQLGEGMSFLHEKRIVHRDLKTRSILIKHGKGTKANMKPYLHVKVADFGLSKTKEHSAYSNMTLNVGTTRWMAPEVMKIANDDDQARKVELKFPFKSDVYSFAMVCYEILTGDEPFSSLSFMSEVKRLVLCGGRPELPHECPNRLRTLITACWSAEVATRPKFGGICEELRNLKYGNLMTYWVGYKSPLSGEDISAISECAANLSSPSVEVQRSAAYAIRLLSEKTVDHRISIATQGVIPLLIVLLLSPDQKTQEHAVTAMLNLSITDSNKERIVVAGAIEPIVEVLRLGCMEARENAAATLFSLSLVDENKITIGSSGAIPALVQLLHDGTARGKKDAATALFNLSIYQGNKAHAVQAGVVPPLMSLIAEQPATMLDEALAILAILATHPEGRIAIGEVGPTPMWMRIIVSESARNKENAAAILLALCLHYSGYIKQVRESNAFESLTVLVHSRESTIRAKRKALQLLELLKKPEVETVSHRVNAAFGACECGYSLCKCCMFARSLEAL